MLEGSFRMFRSQSFKTRWFIRMQIVGVLGLKEVSRKGVVSNAFLAATFKPFLLWRDVEDKIISRIDKKGSFHTMSCHSSLFSDDIISFCVVSQLRNFNPEISILLQWVVGKNFWPQANMWIEVGACSIDVASVMELRDLHCAPFFKLMDH